MTRAAAPTARDGKAEELLFQALAHPTRREILLVLRLRGGAMSAGQIAERFACRWPTVTRHLAVLEEAGIVAVRKSGRERIYRLRHRRLLSNLDRWTRWFRR